MKTFRKQSMVMATLAKTIGIFFCLSMPAKAAQDPRHVLVVIFENTDYEKTINQPFFARLSNEGVNLTNMRAEIHPSQGNYIALTSGDSYGVNHDRNITLDVKHIGNLLEEHGKNWKVYAQDWPGDCFLGARSGRYVRKHVPFLSYKNVTSSPEQCSHIVDANELTRDIANNTLPEVAFYIPNLDNDAHDTSIEFADQWYQEFMGPLLKDPKFVDNLVLISTFDENGGSPGNQIYTSLWGPTVKAGSEIDQLFDHYSLLRMIEDIFGLGQLTAKDRNAARITGWQR